MYSGVAGGALLHLDRQCGLDGHSRDRGHVHAEDSLASLLLLAFRERPGLARRHQARRAARRMLSCRQTWAVAVGRFITDSIWWLCLFWPPSDVFPRSAVASVFDLGGTTAALAA
jgi:hypothetical protein